MLRSVFWYVFFVVSVALGLGAFGHGYSARRVHEALDPFPINPAMSKTIYIVWYFVSGAMLMFGGVLISIALRVRAGDSSSLFVAYWIAALYMLFGICATIYRRNDPFWLFFILLGVLLLGSSLVLKTQQAPGT